VKRYLLFGGDHYYPEGGIYDYVGEFDTLEEALAVGMAAHPPEHYCWKPDNVKWCGKTAYDWYHVVDSTTTTKIAGV